MLDLTEHKKIVVLIDADNAQHSKIKFILNKISTHGHIITKRAYGDWSSEHLKNWKSTLNELAIQPIQQFAYTTGKNSTDASLIIDAMDLLYTNRYDAFVIISSDSDFTKLASRLREAEMYVFGVGEN
ncbi:NYN domain-containing protein [Aeromonas salmonicida]|uniref:NYN domain-containing protein n=1 Tax=Aeromonas salmonicida TaxID=645 RepID=UPI00223FE093|nr:NYN domain-containing protein [Aeromonas salmonicida]